MVEIEPGVRMKCVPNYCYPDDIYLVPVVWRKLKLERNVFELIGKVISYLDSSLCIVQSIISRDRFVELLSSEF